MKPSLKEKMLNDDLERLMADYLDTGSLCALAMTDRSSFVNVVIGVD